MNRDYIHPWYKECMVTKCINPYAYLMWFYRKTNEVLVHTRFLICDEHVDEVYEGFRQNNKPHASFKMRV